MGDIWYVYRHIRLDKNEPFYIGIGCKKNLERAYNKSNRNKWWKNIVSKTDYEVDILIDGVSFDQAAEKEKEFIKLYGREDLNTGTLVNMTDGGEGASGFIQTTEHIAKRVSANTGKKRSIETRSRMSSIHSGRSKSVLTRSKMSDSKTGVSRSIEFKTNMSKPVFVYNYNTGELVGEWYGIKAACAALGIKSRGSASEVASGKRNQTHGYTLRYKNN